MLQGFLWLRMATSYFVLLLICSLVWKSQRDVSTAAYHTFWLVIDLI